jgi:SAM-dependent methyltransferase
MTGEDPETVKACCASFYESDPVRRVLGENFHPGGERLTLQLGNLLGLDGSMRVLDVACGAGATSLALARDFGCRVTGIDLSGANLTRAEERGEEAGVADLVEFVTMDAEDLTFDDGVFDAVVTECALCTFPDMGVALAEIYRVLGPGGRIGVTDVVVERELPPRAQGMLFRVACISGALPSEGYTDALEAAGFTEVTHEDHSYAITQLLDKAEKVAMGWQLAETLLGVDLEAWLGMSEQEAKDMLAGARDWVDRGDLGYAIFTGTRA